jgi:hypothetical protein
MQPRILEIRKEKFWLTFSYWSFLIYVALISLLDVIKYFEGKKISYGVYEIWLGVFALITIKNFISRRLYPYEFEIADGQIKWDNRLIPLSDVYEITLNYEWTYKRIMLFYPDKKTTSVSLSNVSKEDAQKMYDYLKEMIRERQEATV